jgi:hypothetical protein
VHAAAPRYADPSMRLRILIISAVVVVAASAIWWALKPRHGDEAVVDSALAASAADVSTPPMEASGARCLDRNGQFRPSLPDGSCPMDRAGSRLAPQDPKDEIDGSCESQNQSAPPGPQDPVLAAMSQGVCY